MAAPVRLRALRYGATLAFARAEGAGKSGVVRSGITSNRAYKFLESLWDIGILFTID
jgi:hypothetical protein